MADGHNATLISKDRDANAVANPIYVQLTDGTDVALINGSGQLEVSGSFTSGAEYAEDSAHTTGDVGQYVLAVRQDTLAASVSADGDYGSLKLNSVGALYVDVSNSTLAVTQSGTWDIDTVTTLTSITNDVNIADGGNSITVDNAGTFAVQVDGDALTALQLIDDVVFAEDAAHTTGDKGNFVLAVRNEGLTTLTSADLDYSGIAVTKEGAVYTEILQGGLVNSETNPIYTHNVESVISGIEVTNYNTAAAVAKDATSNHDYTVVGGTFILEKVSASSSSDLKIEVQTGALAGLQTIWVGFNGSKSGGTIEHIFTHHEVPVTGTGTVRVIRTNRGAAALDLYSTIEGTQRA